MKIIDLMIANGDITMSDLRSLPVSVQKDQEVLIESLGQSGKLSVTLQAKYKAVAYNFDVRTDDEMNLTTPIEIKGVPRSFMQHFTVCPIEIGEKYIVWACPDLPNKKLMSQIVLRNRTSSHQFVWASATSIEAALERMLDGNINSLKPLIDQAFMQISHGNDDLIITLTDEILRTAFKKGASDVHIEILNRKPVVLARYDGELEDVVSLPLEVYERVLGRLRHMSGVRAENYKKPLYGRMTFEISNRERIDIRYTTQPISLEGTAKIALRFLRSFEGSMDGLGYEDVSVAKIDQLMKFEEGVIIFAGPTGSGKSTAARLMIKRGQRPGQNVISYEKQIEERMNNVIQTEEDVTAGLTLESFMYAALGLDPDVVFLGEVRSDMDTQKCIDAGNLGHLVITTMHANDAFMTLDRLLQRGVPAEQIFGNVRGVVAQRLVRKLCPQCKIKYKLKAEEAEVVNSVRNVGLKEGDSIYRANEMGCVNCENRGYSGRTAFEEILELWREDLKQDIWSGSLLRPDWIDVVRDNTHKVKMNDMLHSGLRHVKSGVTSIEEVRKYFSADLEVIKFV
ncbi:MAG: Flp pilus assembly complex ATPase component [Proteobacteria bacterium]|nr:Flp pilus assembly complex ATPase component [Pseudomonadota bacterium]